MVCVSRQSGFIELSSCFVTTDIESTKSRSMVRAISGNEQCASWFWICLFFGMVLYAEFVCCLVGFRACNHCQQIFHELYTTIIPDA